MHRLDANKPPLPGDNEHGDTDSEDFHWTYDSKTAREVSNKSPQPGHERIVKPAEIILHPRIRPPTPARYQRPPEDQQYDMSAANTITVDAPRPQDYGNSPPPRQYRGAALSPSSARGVPSPVPAPNTPQTAQRRDTGMSPHSNSAMRRATTPPPSSSAARRSQAPYAEHYPANALYDVDGPVNDFQLGGYQLDRNGIPRGRAGVDYEEGQAREAQRLAEDMRKRQEIAAKKERQALLKAQLDQLVEMKNEMKIEERELEERTVYGYSLPGVGKDLNSARAKRQQSRKELEEIWRKQAAERETKRKAEDEYYRRPEENWQTMDSQIQRSRELAAQTPAIAATDAHSKWLGAWQEHQEEEARARQAMEAERQRIEAALLKPHVANYSDRILLGEQVRRQNHERYKQELDEQVRQRQYDKQHRAVENYQRNARFHRPPFVKYSDSFH